MLCLSNFNTLFFPFLPPNQVDSCGKICEDLIITMKIYTKKGDQGKTSLVDGSRVTKNHPRLETYGTLDELNSHVGLLISLLCLEQSNSNEKRSSDKSTFSEDIEFLKQVQVWLFQLGSQLACNDSKTSGKLPTLTEKEINTIEHSIDNLESSLPKLRNFILPGGHQASSQAHVCRTVNRRVERLCVALNEKTNPEYPAIAFLNRLSDYFFILARSINHRLNIKNIEWVP